MSFAYSAGVITQTGTDTNLSGLSGLTGITTWTSDPDISAWGQNFYVMDASTRLEIQGTLTIEPDVECLIVEGVPINDTSTNPVIVDNGAVLNYGVAKTGNGNTLYSEGVGLNLTDKGTTVFGYFSLVVKGTFNWNGGVIRTASSIRFIDNSIVTVTKGTFLNVANDSSHFRLTPTSTAGGSNMNVNDLTMTATTTPPTFFTTWGFNNAVFTLKNGRVQQYNGDYPEQVYVDFKNSGNINSTDFLFTNTVATRGGNIIFNNVEKRVSYSFSTRYGYIKTTRSISLSPEDLNGSGLTYSFYGKDINNGNRTIGSNDGGTDADGQPVDQDDTADKVYSGINQTGAYTTDLLIETLANIAGTGTADDRTTSDTIPIRFISYNETITIWNSNLIGAGTLTEDVVMTPDLSISEANKATVDAYTTLDKAQELYDRSKADLVDNYAGETSTTISRSGTVIDATGLTVTVNGDGATVYDLTGSAITIKSANYTGGFANTTVSHGTGSPLFTDLVLENATWNADQATWTGSADSTSTVDVQATGTYDASGFTFDASSTLNNDTGGVVNIRLATGQQQPTVINGVGATTNFIGVILTGTVSNIVVGSRIRIYNNTTLTEVANEIVAGTTYTANYSEGSDYTAGDLITVFLTCQIGTTACSLFKQNVTATSSGWSMTAEQTTDEFYSQFNVDGSTITEFSWDGVNLEIDINDADNETIIQRLGAWYFYFIATEEGIRDFFDCIKWEFYNQIQIDTDLCDVRLDNKKTDALLLEGGRLYRKDGTTIVSPTTTGAIHVVGGVGPAKGSGIAKLSLNLGSRRSSLSITAKVYLNNVLQGSVALVEGASGVYSADYDISTAVDGQYSVRFDSPTRRVGSGELYVRGNQEVTPDQFFDPNFDIVQSVGASTNNLDLPPVELNLKAEIDANEAKIDALNNISTADVKAQADQALIDYDAPTRAELTSDINSVIAEVNANEVKIDILDTNVDSIVAKLPTGTISDFDEATDQVIVSTNNDKTGYSISGTKTTLDSLNDIASTDIVSAGAITTLSGAVVNVDTVDVCTTNTDMRGTDGANTIAPDNAGISANGVAISALNNYDPAIDQVIVATNNDKSGYSIAGVKTTLDDLNDITTAQVNTEVDTALNDYDAPTRAELTSDINSVIAEVNANEVKIDIVDANVDTIVSKLPVGNISDFDESTDQVTVATNNDKTGYTLTSADKDDIVDRTWDEAYLDHTTAGTFGKLLDNLRKANLTIDGNVTANPTTLSFDTNVSDPTGTHNEQVILFVSGALTGQSKPILTFTNGVNNTITLQEALTVAPSINDEFVILPYHVHPITLIQQGLSTFDHTTDEVITDTASRNASKADVSLLGTHADLIVINDGVKKSSKLIPHNEDL